MPARPPNTAAINSPEDSDCLTFSERVQFLISHNYSTHLVMYQTLGDAVNAAQQPDFLMALGGQDELNKALRMAWLHCQHRYPYGWNHVQPMSSIIHILRVFRPIAFWLRQRSAWRLERR